MVAAVGPMQFEVVSYRMEHEFGAPAVLDRLDYSVAMGTDADGRAELAGYPGVEVLRRDADGALLALFVNRWRVNTVRGEHPGVRLDPLVAGRE